jgi:hypothetical protein
VTNRDSNVLTQSLRRDDEQRLSGPTRCALGTPYNGLRLLLSELGKVAIPTGPEDFDAEGEALEHALTKSFLILNEAMISLCSSVRRFRDATTKKECKSDYPHALYVLWKALDRAKDLIRD